MDDGAEAGMTLPPEHDNTGWIAQLRALGQTLRVPAVLVLCLICCGVELTLEAADAGWVGSRLWRGMAYQNGAFWEGLLYNWRPNYGAQPAAMFVTYAFLHADFWHLAGNMIALLLLARIVLARVGQLGFLLIYTLSAFGGACVFVLLAQTPAPMVGASGALFGLAGAWQYWEWLELRAAGLSLTPLWRSLAVLVLLNVVLWLMNDGGLAWQTHLGGFVFGWGGSYGIGLVLSKGK